MRGGVILPERPQIANLPAPDGFGRSFVTGVWCELVVSVKRATGLGFGRG